MSIPSPASSAVAPVAYRAFVPVKSWSRAKTRLGLDPGTRARLALAFATDTLRALADTPRIADIVVVTDDAHEIHQLPAGDWEVHVDPDADGLNDALVRANSSWHRADGLAVLAVCADLPALRPVDVSDLLDTADAIFATDPHALGWFVGDALGPGTTVLATIDASRFAPAFGAGSRAAHGRAGLIDLSEHAPARVRQDVDIVEDLTTVRRWGVGSATAAAFAELGLGTA